MLQIIYRDGTTDEKEGKVKHYTGEYSWSSHYDYEIDGIQSQYYTRVKEFKFVYDTETREGVYYTYSAMIFFKSNEYDHYYNKSLSEIQLEQKFKEYMEIFLEVPNLSIEEVPEWLACYKDEIQKIYNNCQ
jgi:hypothetical protein